MARRSVLFTPGDRPEMLRTAPETGADVVVCDLEDAVVPGRKADARETVASAITDASFDPTCEVCVRVNPGSIAVDLDGVLVEGARVDSVMLPKAESPADVRRLTTELHDRGAGHLAVFALCETAAGVLQAEAIANVDGMAAIIFGAEDLAADIGATRTEAGEEVLYARQHVVLAASAADVDAIDTVFTDIEATDQLAAETERALGLGYDGKVAIHPAQVSVINEAFTPDPEAIEWAERVIEGAEAAESAERGVFRVGDEMIDAPLVTRAERILERARAAGER